MFWLDIILVIEQRACYAFAAFDWEAAVDGVAKHRHVPQLLA
jgi:hypothetical protein